jgi:hypothetical protein
MTSFRVTLDHVWRHTDGRSCSFYGAAPHGPGWAVEPTGWAVWNDRCIIAAYPDKAAADAHAARLQAKAECELGAHREAFKHRAAPIVWRRAAGNDGVTRHHSGERYSIACHCGWFQVEHDGNAGENPGFRSLAKAKAWCARVIMSGRDDIAFDRVA